MKKQMLGLSHQLKDTRQSQDSEFESKPPAASMMPPKAQLYPPSHPPTEPVGPPSPNLQLSSPHRLGRLPSN